MKIGDLEIKVFDKKFYCRYCEDEASCEKKRKHRRGIAYKVAVSINNEHIASFLLTRGEFEDIEDLGLDRYVGAWKRTGMSGCESYERAYKTCGGWWSIASQEIEEIGEEITDYDPITFASILDEHKVFILTKLVSKKKEIINYDWGLWNAIKPLIYTYISGKTIALPQEAYINYYPMSFKATFKLRNIEIPVVKARPSISVLVDYIDVRLGEKTKIVYRADPHKATVILKQGWKTYLYEQYKYRDVQVYDLTYGVKDEHLLLFNRLGKVVFVPKIMRNEDYQEVKDEEVIRMLSEFHVVNAKFCQIDGNIFLIPEDKEKDILIYHSDHGTLIPNAQPYQIDFIS